LIYGTTCSLRARFEILNFRNTVELGRVRRYAKIMMIWRKIALGILPVLLAVPAFAYPREASPEPYSFDPPESVPQISVEKSGAIPTKPGMTLRLNADPGDVRVFTDESTQVTYHVVVQADSRAPGAEDFLKKFNLGARPVPGGVSLDAQLPWRVFQGQFAVSLEIHVPRKYSLKINTQGGNIDVQDIEGQVDLGTGGGNITVGSVSPPADAKDASPHSASGHAGNIAAHLETQGGHIRIGDVAGTLRATTAGGHITTGNIGGDGILQTGGGQIQTGHITGAATLETGGGNIRFEKSGSSVTADTAGGQIDFAEASGTIRTHTGGGAVRIDHVTAPAVVETNGGGIFLRKVDAQLRVSSTGGDIVVYLPRLLAATIDAVVDRGDGHTILADPSLPLRISYQDSGPGPHAIRCAGDLNGGGNILHLRAKSGNIILKTGDPRAGSNGAMRAAAASTEPESPAMQPWNSDDAAAGFFEEVRRRVLESWWGAVPVEASEMQSHLENSVAPIYPDVARAAGIEGDVALRVYVSSDGHVTDIRVLDGPPILARAAAKAVQQWQYQSPAIDGHPTNVVTTLIVSFRLN
jgi:TonB family protein